MKSRADIFKINAERVAQDLQHRETLNFNISKYDAAVNIGRNRYTDLSLAKTSASDIKSYVVNNLPYLLEDFEANAVKNGAEVYWAQSSEDLISQLSEILISLDVNILVKSKSMVTEEIELNHHLEKINIESVETDLGEFIVQVAGEKPYHIVTPAMHKSKQDIADLFNKHFGTDKSLSAEELTDFVRVYLRKKFVEADVGVTGANFLCAEEGAVAVTENEGNALLSASFPKIHIVIAGIEKVLPGIEDLSLFWPLLAAHGTGQQISVYSNLFFGPKKNNEYNGPERMIIFLLDNKRSEIYTDDTLRDSLKCIRCGACLNGCPVYKNIGGYTYDTTYSGPIGSVISPHFKDFGQYNHLSFASSLCGKCNEVCPVQLPLTKMLLYNREKAVEQSSLKTKLLNNFLYLSLSNRSILNSAGGRIKTIFSGLFHTSLIGRKKKLSSFSSQTFSQQWKKNKKIL